MRARSDDSGSGSRRPVPNVAHEIDDASSFARGLKRIEVFMGEPTTHTAFPSWIAHDLENDRAARASAARNRYRSESRRIDDIEVSAFSEDPTKRSKCSRGPRPATRKALRVVIQARVALLGEGQHQHFVSTCTQFGADIVSVRSRTPDIWGEDPAHDQNSHGSRRLHVDLLWRARAHGRDSRAQPPSSLWANPCCPTP